MKTFMWKISNVTTFLNFNVEDGAVEKVVDSDPQPWKKREPTYSEQC